MSDYDRPNFGTVIPREKLRPETDRRSSQQKHAQIDEQVQAFLDGGGKIDVIPYNPDKPHAVKTRSWNFLH